MTGTTRLGSSTDQSGGWAVWYVQDSTVVGVLTCDWDAEYERGQTLIERGADLSEALSTTGAPT